MPMPKKKKRTKITVASDADAKKNGKIIIRKTSLASEETGLQPVVMPGSVEGEAMTMPGQSGCQ